MYQGLSVSRRGLAFVLILFCLPLFIGLRSLDLETDEAIYSFAVERMLVDGEWMQPKSSPSDTVVFLEKPPLKFWMVAAPIRLGLMPNDEFGLRFWDALMGAIAFAYVFAIGSRLAGAVCGTVAVMLLFVHYPLVFEHGLRTNNMEGALFLAYCGGVFHFLEWGGERSTRRGVHAFATGLYFVLGFMTKFVAAIFLPAVVGLAALLLPATRARLWRDRRRWLGVVGVGLLLILPWFVYAQVKFGSQVLDIMLAEHVYARMRTGLNPEHVQPWSYYVTTLWHAATWGHIAWFVPIGVIVLAIQALRRRWFEAVTVLLWGVLPLAVVSFGSSKLYHYAYPFLPPLMLAAGYFVALVLMLAPPLVRKAGERLEDLLVRRIPRLGTLAVAPWMQGTATVLIVMAAALGFWAVVFGGVRLQIGSTVLLKSSGVVRPIVAVAVAAILARRSARVSVLIVVLALSWWLPVDAYKATFVRLTTEVHPLRDVSSCILDVERRTTPALPAGLFVDTDSSMWHPITFYFRRIEPWIRQERASAERLADTLRAPSYMPSLVQELRYRDYLNGPERVRFGVETTPPMVGLFEYALLLPGPYRACSPEARLKTVY